MRTVLAIGATVAAIFCASTLHGPAAAAPALVTAEHEAAVKGVYDALSRPWTDMCNDATRTRLAGALSTYFIGRARAPKKPRWRWPWSKPVVADYWDGARDASIDLLTRVSFERGFVALANLDEGARPGVAELVRGRRIPEQCERRPEPWRVQENGGEGIRDYARTGAMEQLSQLWSELCPELDRRSFAHHVGTYFGARSWDHERWALYGEPGLRFVTAAWGTETDRTIESLTRNAAAQGLVNADTIPPAARALYASVVKGVTANARPCDKDVTPRS